MRTVVVAGTTTEVGKTWVTARLVATMRETGITAAARKPVQSFDPRSSEDTDAEVLSAASGEDPHQVCPPHRWLGVAMAPPMAAAALGLDPPLLDDLCREIVWPDPLPSVGFVESVGGVRSPLADDADTVDLVARLEPDLVLVVADADLGVIDNVRLALDALASSRVIVFLNRFDDASDLHRRNLAWLRDRDHIDICTDLHELVDRIMA